MTAEALPRVLLVEDDPISRAFLSAALDAVPCEVDSADGVAAALALARSQRYDAWLLDAHLPDGSGIDLLQRLRKLHPDTPVLAHTASRDESLHDSLRRAGFAEVVVKPLPAPAMRGRVRALLGLPATPEAAPPARAQPGNEPVWDDEAAARALNGNLAHVQTLRGLFLQELSHIHDDVGAAFHRGDHDHMQRSLHKLRASCGFVGARRLACAVQALESRPDSSAAWALFEAALTGTLETPAQP